MQTLVRFMLLALCASFIMAGGPLVNAGSAQAASITVTSPEQGDSWPYATTQTIEWTSDDISSSVDIELCRSLGIAKVCDTDIATGVTDTGSYSWVIPADIGAQGNLFVRVSDAVDSSVSGDSGSFSITEPTGLFISVTDPSSQEELAPGQNYTIRWLASNFVTEDLTIELYKSGVFIETLAEGVSPSQRAYSWSIPEDITEGDGYQIRVASSVDTTLFGESGVFSIMVPQASLTLTAPTGGESWEAGTSHEVSWTSENLTGTVKVELFKGGVLESTLGSGLATPGSLLWEIPEDLEAATDYSITVTSEEDSSLFSSSENFTLEQVGGSALTITAPATGTSWRVGEAQTVKWNADAEVVGASMRMELYRGVTYSTLIKNLETRVITSLGEADATFEIPTWQGGGYRIRLQSNQNPDIEAWSGYFSLANNVAETGSTVNVSAPAGDAEWQAGETQTITWTSDNYNNDVNLLLYKQGELIETIATFVDNHPDNGGSYEWTLPSDLAAGDDYRLRVDATVGTSFVESEDFSILPAAPEMTITSPKSDSRWNQGESYNIGWTAQDSSGSVNIFLYKNGSQQSQLAGNTSNDGSFNWNVPSSLANGEDYAIRVVRADNSAIYAQSNEFTIAPGTGNESITITAPASGTSWPRGATRAITWDSDGVNGNVKIEVYALVGISQSLVATVASSTPNEGVYYWDIPTSLATGGSYTVVVSSLIYEWATDETAQFFITADEVTPSSITVTGPGAGDSFAPGSDLAVTWETVEVYGDLSVELYQNVEGGEPEMVQSLLSGIEDTGSATWTIPEDFAEGDYFIRVVNDRRTDIYGESGEFSIKASSTQTGWWYNPDSAGTGLSLERHEDGAAGDSIYAVWYVFNNEGAPVWYASLATLDETEGASLKAASSAYSGALLSATGSPLGTSVEEWTGPEFNVVGDMTFTFNDDGTATLVYDVDNATLNPESLRQAEGSMTLRRTMDDIASGERDSRDIHGWWDDENYPGTGFFFEVQGDTLFGAWFNYDESGQSRWWTFGGVPGNFPAGTTNATETVYEFSDGQTIGGEPVTPSPTALEDQISLQVNDDDTWTVEWQGVTYDLRATPF